MMEQNLELPHLLLFAQSIGIGFLIGLERERHENAVAGLRTFTLIALAGSLAGYIRKQSADNEVVILILGLVTASLLVAQFKSKSEDPQTTSVLAGILTFGLGYMLWVGHPVLSAGLAVFITTLLYFRKELRDVPRKLTKQEIISFLQFNPYQVGWLVVLISGLSLLGYLALRLFDHKSGILIIGLLGGMASTTATTLVYAKHSKQQDGFSYIATTIILLSHLVQLVRVGLLVSIIEYTTLPLMIPWLVGGGITGALFVLWSYRRVVSSHVSMPPLDTGNPTKLATAASFALLFAAILFLSAFMNDVLADTGVFLVSFVSGLTDLDAITVSNLKLVSDGIVAPKIATYAVILAFFANLVFKFGIIVVSGDRALRWPAFLGFSSLSAGVFSGMISYEYL